MTVQEILQELELHSDKSDKTSKERRKGLWSELLPHFGEEVTSDVAGDLAHELGVQPITVRRWISGEYAPRPALLKRLRNRFGVEAVPSGSSLRKGVGPDAPVPFAGSFAALRTIDHFFYCLGFARTCFVFKGLLPFHAGRSKQTQDQVVNALRNQPSLKIYYIFPEGTEAAKTYDKFHKSVLQIDSAVCDRIRQVCVPPHQDQMGLERSLASPFVVLYNPQGVETFGKFGDIWYEVPVERLDLNNRVNDQEGPLFVFAQLPWDHSEQVWDQWRECLKCLPDGSTLDKADLE